MSQRNPFSRRKFLRHSLTGLAGIPFVSSKCITAPDPVTGQGMPSGFIHRLLGKTGIKAPVVGMGVMNADNPALVRRSFELGVRHFDTAAYYQRGRNEEMVGSVLEEIKGRKESVIATKVFIPHHLRSMSAEEVKNFYLKTAEESLKRLKTDYIDILYSHNVGDSAWLNHPGVLEALYTLKKSGKTLCIGFSTHENMDEMIREATKTGVYEVILTTFNYSLSDDPVYKETLKRAAEKGIALVAMKTQCQQPWYREEYETEARRKYYQGTLIHTALLKWVLRHKFITCAIPGYVNFQQMEEDVSVARNLELTPEEKSFLLDRNIKLAMRAVCRRCRQCIGQCPRGVNIPELMRLHMYAASYGNLSQAGNLFAQPSVSSGLKECRQCSECRVQCRGSVQISRRIHELKEIFA